MNIYFLTQALLLGIVVGHIQYELIDQIYIRMNQVSQEARILLISEANTVLLISENFIAAYDMKTLNNLSQISIHTQSRIKQVNYLIIESPQRIYIVVQTESNEFKYFKFFTSSQPFMQQKSIIIYPLLYPIVYDLNLSNTTTTDQENENKNEFIYILENHAQVEQNHIQRNNLSVMKYSKINQRIETFCSITCQFGEEDLQVKCKETSYLNFELNKFAIDLNEQYFFENIDSLNYIFFFNKFEIIVLQSSQIISHDSLIDKFKFQNQPIFNQTALTRQEEFTNFTFWKMGQISAQQLVFVYSNESKFSEETFQRNNEKDFYIVMYNTIVKKIIKVEKIVARQYGQLNNLKDNFNVDILYYTKKILIQSGIELTEIAVMDYSVFYISNHNIGSTFFQFSSQNVRFLELSYFHEGQIAPFAISKCKQQSQPSYCIYLQNCQSYSENNNNNKESYFANEFSCKKKSSCRSYLQFQSKYVLSQEVCLFVDEEKERKSSYSWYKTPTFIILSIVIGVIGIKKIIKYFKIAINKIRQYRAGNSIENRNLLKQDISEREKDGDNNKMREEIELTSSNNQVVIQSPSIYINTNSNEQKPLNEQISDLKSQSSDSSAGFQKQGTSNNDYNVGITPSSQEGQFIKQLHQQQSHLKDSYYNQSQLYYQQLQKEEKIRQLKLLYEQQQQLMIENKNKTQYIQQSKSAQSIPLEQVNNPQIFPNYGFQGNNIIPHQNQIFNQNNQYYNQNMHPLYPPQHNPTSSEQQYFLNQNISNQINNQNIQQESMKEQTIIQPIMNGQFQIGQSTYIPQQKQNQQMSNNQIMPFNRISNDPNSNLNKDNNMILNNVNQANLTQNQQEKQNNNQNFSNQNNQEMKNTHLNITQQLKFFQWALDQQFGYNQLNQNPLPHIIDDSLFRKSQSNLSNSNQSQQIADQQQLQQTLSSFQQFLSIELGDSSQADNKPFILSHSQIDKLTQTLHQQYEIYKNSGINNLQQKEESEIFQMFLKNELKSDLIFDQSNQQFQQQDAQVQDSLKSTAATNAVLSNSSIQKSQNQDNQNQKQLIEEEQKQQSEQNQNKKYANINLGLQKQKSVEILEDKEDKNTLTKVNSQNPQDNLNQSSKSQPYKHVVSKEDTRLCQICYLNEKDSAYKCGHRYCYTCAIEVRNKFGKCSFCNLEVEDVIKLYD
ncbi:hypothetical protein ABPG72_019371 [Tetrahymena utriculariae]